MTTQTRSEETPNPAPQAKSISDPDISFTEYEALRKAGKETSDETPDPKSGLEDESSEQKDPAESDPAETEETEEEAEETSESDADEAEGDEEETEEPKPKKKSGVQKRIDKLRARERAALERAERAEALLAQQERAGGKKGEEAESAPESNDGEPQPEDFESNKDYVKALVKWERQQEDKARKAAEERSKAEAEEAELLDAHTARMDAYAEKNEDFVEAIGELRRSGAKLSVAVDRALIESEMGPEVLHELAKNPKELKRINSLGVTAAAREIGKIEARLSKTSEPKVEIKKVTNAPRPVEPVGGAGGARAPQSIYDPKISFSDYERIRNRQLNRA
jgi:hypothetical protein